MLYEVITRSSGELDEHVLKAEVAVDFEDQIDERRDFRLDLVLAAKDVGRITSYNVCYTKLLRRVREESCKVKPKAKLFLPESGQCYHLQPVGNRSIEYPTRRF